MTVLKEKFEIRYMAELGIIDLFGMSLSEEELKTRVEFDVKDEYGSHFHSFYNRIASSDVDSAIEEVEQIIKNKTNEMPVLVRFFAIPDFAYSGFELSIVAKIDNNGSTFVFSKTKKLLEYLNEETGYDLFIQEI